MICLPTGSRSTSCPVNFPGKERREGAGSRLSVEGGRAGRAQGKSCCPRREKPLAPPRAGSSGAAPQAEGGRSRRREARLREGTAECRRSGDSGGNSQVPHRETSTLLPEPRETSAFPYPFTHDTHTILAHCTHAVSPHVPLLWGHHLWEVRGWGTALLPSGPLRPGWFRTGPCREYISPAEGATASLSPASSRYKSVMGRREGWAPGLCLVPCVIRN